MTEVRLKDFSRKVNDLTFTADGDEFKCVPAFSPEGLQDLLFLVKGFKADDPDMKIVREFFSKVLFPESFMIIGPRLDVGATNPLDLNQCMGIMSWLTEEYGQRPTEPSSNSSEQSPTEETGTSLTDGAPREVLIPLS